MIIDAAIMLAICSLVVEAVIVWAIPPLHRFYMNSKLGMLVNVLASVGLSIALGKAFGADGLIVMMGGIISTAASALGFHRLTYLAKDNWTEIVRGWNQIKGQTIRLAHSMVNFVKFLLAIPIAIGRAYGWTVTKTEQVKTFTSSLRKGLTS